MHEENGRPDRPSRSVCCPAQEKEDQEMSGIVQKRERAISNPSEIFEPYQLALANGPVLGV